MSNNLENTEVHVDERITALEQRMEEQRDEMRRELNALIKMNRALSRENEFLLKGTTTPVTQFHNVIPVGLTNATLLPPEAFVEVEAVVAKKTYKRNRVEHLRRADSSDSHNADS